MSEGTNRNLSAGNTLIQLLALYTDPECTALQTDRVTDGRQDDAHSRSYCVSVRSAKTYVSADRAGLYRIRCSHNQRPTVQRQVAATSYDGQRARASPSRRTSRFQSRTRTPARIIHITCKYTVDSAALYLFESGTDPISLLIILVVFFILLWQPLQKCQKLRRFKSDQDELRYNCNINTHPLTESDF